MKERKIYEIPNIDFIERIDDPYIGMIFYVADIDTYYSVKTLKEINGINMKGSKVVEYVIDEYADFGTGTFTISIDNPPHSNQTKKGEI